MILGEKDEERKLHYIINRGEIFLDKCDAFSALGRLYIVRCADYRKADRIISSNGMKPAEEYLYESAARQILEVSSTSSNDELKIGVGEIDDEKCDEGKKKGVITKTVSVVDNISLLKQRKKFNRRTHITLKAFKVLVESGFTDSSRNEILKMGIEDIYRQKEYFLNLCANKTLVTKSVAPKKANLNIKEEIKPQPAKRKTKVLSNPSSSSGIESGNSSDIESCEGNENNSLLNENTGKTGNTTLISNESKTKSPIDSLKSTNKACQPVEPPDKTKSCHGKGESIENKKKKRQKIEQETVEKGASINTCRLLGRDVNFIIMYEEIYLDLKAISNFFPANKEKCSTPALLRKKSKHLHFEHPPFFPPRRFTKHSTNYVWLSCLATLVDQDLVSPIAGKKNQLLDDFKLILSNEEVNNTSSHEKKPAITDEYIKEEPIHPPIPEMKQGKVIKKRKKSIDEKVIVPTKRSKSGASSNSIKNTSSVNIFGIDYEIQVARNTIYLDKVAIFQLFKVSKSYQKHSNSTYRNIDRLLDRAKLSPDEAFLFEGRKRKYISIQALTILIEQNFLQLLEDGTESINVNDEIDQKPVVNEERESINENSSTKMFLVRLNEIEKSSSLLEDKQTLKLPSFNKIEFRPANQTLYLKTLHYMQAVGFSTNYVYRDSPSKAYFVLARLLKSRGLNLNACFLQHHKAKYGYISVYAAMV